MNLCGKCKHKLGMNYSGEKVRCCKRGTKRPRARKCKEFEEAKA